MSSALLAALFAILGTALAGTSTACWVLWRRVRTLGAAAAPALREPPTAVSVALPGIGVEPARPRDEPAMARRLDELAGRNRALEARLARIETSTAEAALVIASEPGGPRVGRRLDRGSATLIAVPNLAAPASPASEAAAELARRFGAIWAMADAGEPVEAIARETGHPIGQVELILGLRRRLPEAGAGLDA